MRQVNRLQFFSTLFCFCAGAQAQSPGPTAALLQELIRVNTSNPPGNEAKIDDLLAAKLRPLGFQIDIIPTPVARKSALSPG